MDIKALKHYIANKSPKKTLSESLEYKVERVTVIPHQEVHTGIAGTQKTIAFPNAGKTAVLLRFKDGKITTGVGKNKEEAIQDAVQSKVALFGESFAGEHKAAIIGLPTLKDTKKMAASVENVIAQVEKKTTTNVSNKARLLNNLKELHSMLASNRIDPSEIDILQHEIIADLNRI